MSLFLFSLGLAVKLQELAVCLSFQIHDRAHDRAHFLGLSNQVVYRGIYARFYPVNGSDDAGTLPSHSITESPTHVNDAGTLPSHSMKCDCNSV